MFHITVSLKTSIDFSITQDLANNPLYGRIKVTLLCADEYGYIVDSNWIESVMCLHGVIIGKRWKDINVEVIDHNTGEVVYDNTTNWI